MRSSGLSLLWASIVLSGPNFALHHCFLIPTEAVPGPLVPNMGIDIAGLVLIPFSEKHSKLLYLGGEQKRQVMLVLKDTSPLHQLIPSIYQYSPLMPFQSLYKSFHTSSFSTTLFSFPSTHFFLKSFQYRRNSRTKLLLVLNISSPWLSVPPGGVLASLYV